MLSRHVRCVLSRLRCNGHSLLLSSYLSRIGRIENFSCSACGHSSPNISHLILHCLCTDSLRGSPFWRLSVSLQSLAQALGSCTVLGINGLPPCPPFLKRGRVTTTTTKTSNINAIAENISLFSSIFQLLV